MSSSQLLRVAVLVNLPLSPLSGGHARGWSRIARAAASATLPLDLTVYFSGPEKTQDLSDHVHLRYLPSVFSTAQLKFLPYVPDNTDLAPYHPKLARELKSFDLIHTTDGFFAFARTAALVSKRTGIPLTNSFHTDTPGYARLFTQRTIDNLLGGGVFSRFLSKTLRLPEREETKMLRRLRKHLRACRHAIATRREDMELAAEILGGGHVSFMRTPVEREIFTPARRDRAAIEADYKIPRGRVLVLFTGRLDEGKNIFTLIGAMEPLLAQGVPLHLIAAGLGPAMEALKARLGEHVTTPGFVQPIELGRLMASADLLAHPSEVELRSLVAIEAMASGLPVLLSEKGGVAQHYGRPKAMIEVGSSLQDWSEALRKLAENPKLRSELGAQALAYTRANIPSSLELLTQDFLPIWQKTFHERRG